MSWNSEVNHVEYTGVFKLVNSYIPVHVNEGATSFLSNNPVIDLKIAQAVAQKFAEMNDIPYHGNLLERNDPIISVVQHESTWYPAELHPDKISLLMFLGPMPLGGTVEEAQNLARVIALSKQTACLPNMFLHGGIEPIPQ